MPEFVGEHYLAAEAAPDAGHCAKAARAAADQLRREGTRVHHVRSILIPDDETCIHLFRAESIEAVRTAAARASLRLDRLTEAVSGTGRSLARTALTTRITASQSGMRTGPSARIKVSICNRYRRAVRHRSSCR